MPLLAALISTLSTSIGSLIFKIFLIPKTFRALGIAAVLSLWAALLLTFNTLVSPLIGQIFSTQYGQFIGLAFPPIAGTCLTTIVTAATAVQIYRIKRRFLEQTTGA